MMSKHIEKKAKNKEVTIIIFIMFFIMFVVSTIILINWNINNKKTEKLMEEIVRENYNSNSQKQENKIEENETQKDETIINFENLKSINSDVVGWIKIDETNINYPIVQSSNNDYYLKRDLNKEYNVCGWVFMDFRNSNKFIDMNTVIYGHNLKSGKMFADLAKILNQDLGKEVLIKIYTPTENITYKVFSCYKAKPEQYAVNSSIVKEEEQKEYIEEMLKRSSILYNVVPTQSDHLLTLSTCDSTGKNRILVHSACMSREKLSK